MATKRMVRTAKSGKNSRTRRPKRGLRPDSRKTVKTGKSETDLKGMAAHRVQQRIDLELTKPRDLAL